MKRQRSDSQIAASSPTSGSKGGRRISFLRGENKITYVKVPPKSDNAKHWFKEGESIVTKPLNFIIPPGSAVNMDISTNVTLKRMNVVLKTADRADSSDKQKLTSSSSSSKSFDGCTLEIANRDLAAELNLATKAAKANPKGNVASDKETEERIVAANKFYAVGTCAFVAGGSGRPDAYLPTSHCLLKTSLINGVYVLRNSGARPLAVMAVAVDVESKLQ